MFNPIPPKWRLIAAALPVVLGVVLAAGWSLRAQDKPQGPDILPPATPDWATLARDYNPNSAGRYQANKGFAANPKDWQLTPIPMLLPDPAGPVSAAQLTFYSFPDGYDLSLPQPVPGLTVMLSGNRLYVRADPGTLSGVKYDRVVIQGGGQVQPVILSQTEDGWLASFARYGISYTAEIACDSPQADPYCADDAYIRKVAASLNTVVLPPQAQRDFNTAMTGGKPPLKISPGVLKTARPPLTTTGTVR